MNLAPETIAALISSGVSAGLFFGIMRSALSQHADVLKEVRLRLDMVPTLSAKLDVVAAKQELQHEQLMKHASLWPKLDSKVKVLEDQMQSHREFRRVMQSQGGTWRNGGDE